MGRSLVFSTNIPLRFSQTPRSISPRINPNQYQAHKFTSNSPFGYQKVGIFNTNSTRKLCTRALISEISNQRQYPKVGAKSTGPIHPTMLIEVVQTAAKTGAEVVMDAVDKPRNITYKGLTDLVTDTDKMSEAAILEVVKRNFGDHLILGEEGGIIGDTSSDYLWCIDPLDGTTNFAHCYPSFAVSVGVMFQGNPAAAAVIVEEACGTVTRMDGGKFCVFDRSVLVSNGAHFMPSLKIMSHIFEMPKSYTSVSLNNKKVLCKPYSFASKYLMEAEEEGLKKWWKLIMPDWTKLERANGGIDMNGSL
ncbi:hypothetical protein CRYUN_Cryun32bG0066800 [Craigia yunnanensis]